MRKRKTFKNCIGAAVLCLVLLGSLCIPSVPARAAESGSGTTAANTYFFDVYRDWDDTYTHVDDAAYNWHDTYTYTGGDIDFFSMCVYEERDADKDHPTGTMPGNCVLGAVSMEPFTCVYENYYARVNKLNASYTYEAQPKTVDGTTFYYLEMRPNESYHADRLSGLPSLRLYAYDNLTFSSRTRQLDALIDAMLKKYVAEGGLEWSRPAGPYDDSKLVYDASIGYLQGLIYKEEQSQGSSKADSRDASFSWTTAREYPEDAQIQIMAHCSFTENSLLTLFQDVTTSEYWNYKVYGDGIYYSFGLYEFQDWVPALQWLGENEYIVKQHYSDTGWLQDLLNGGGAYIGDVIDEYYLRIVVFNQDDGLFHYGGWTKVNLKDKSITSLPGAVVETGGFDDNTHEWKPDDESDGSYNYKTDSTGNITADLDFNSWDNFNIKSFSWLFNNLQSLTGLLGDFPGLVNTVFGFLPPYFITAIVVMLGFVVILRLLGR